MNSIVIIAVIVWCIIGWLLAYIFSVKKIAKAKEVEKDYQHKLQQIDLEKEKILGEANLKLKEAANELRLSEKKSQDWDDKMLTVEKQTNVLISAAEQKAKDIQAFADPTHAP